MLILFCLLGIIWSNKGGRTLKTIQDPEKLKKVGAFYDKIAVTHYEFFDYWLKNTLFHWDFWLSVVFSILPWTVWIKYRKKDSTQRLLFVGFFALIFSCWMDFFGVMYGLWYYTGKVIPTMPSYIPWDMCIIPVLVMLLVQYKPNSSVLVKALVFAAVCSFIGEPFFLWLGFYVLKKWSFFYSFPIYFLFYLACHKISRLRNFAGI